MSGVVRPFPNLIIVAQAGRVARAYRRVQSSMCHEAHTRHTEILLQEVDALAKLITDEAPQSIFHAAQAGEPRR